MGKINTRGALVSAVLASALPVSASVAPLSFDCDTQINHFSGLTAEVTLPFEISGTISPIELRSGRFLPVATVSVSEAPDGPRIGFQVVAASTQVKELDILFVNTASPDRRTPLGEVDFPGSVSFRLALSETGKGTLLLDGRPFAFDAEPMAGATVQVSCSTGQFKFTDLEWTSNSASPVAP